jgi:tetratricopeptide (TPR) repeat protein
MRCIIQIIYDAQPEYPKAELSDLLGRSIGHQGIDAAIIEIRHLKQNQAVGEPRKFYRSPGEYARRNIGFYYLGQKRTAEAVAVLTLDAESFPNSWNAYDSLGEAQAAAGQREPAIQSYRKVLQLNPKAKSSEKALKLLEGK